MVGGINIDLRAQCMFYALGWNSFSPKWGQFSVFDFAPFTSAINEIQSQMPAHAHMPQTLFLLKYNQVPKQDWLSFKSQKQI